MNFIKKFLAARANRRQEEKKEHIAHIAQISEARKNCEEGNHVFGIWKQRFMETVQYRDCSVCGYREAEDVV